MGFDVILLAALVVLFVVLLYRAWPGWAAKKSTFEGCLPPRTPARYDATPESRIAANELYMAMDVMAGVANQIGTEQMRGLGDLIMRYKNMPPNMINYRRACNSLSSEFFGVQAASYDELADYSEPHLATLYRRLAESMRTLSVRVAALCATLNL